MEVLSSVKPQSAASRKPSLAVPDILLEMIMFVLYFYFGRLNCSVFWLYKLPFHQSSNKSDGPKGFTKANLPRAPKTIKKPVFGT